jgi:hypothetical protein
MLSLIRHKINSNIYHFRKPFTIDKYIISLIKKNISIRFQQKRTNRHSTEITVNTSKNYSTRTYIIMLIKFNDK